MGLFDKIKNIFSDKKEINENTVKYEEGLSKTRVEFTSKLGKLSKKYKEVTSDYFNELEEILIMADVGVNTVMEFMDRLKDRVKKEHITDTDMLKEVIVDELFVIYVEGEILTNKIKFNENVVLQEAFPVTALREINSNYMLSSYNF